MRNPLLIPSCLCLLLTPIAGSSSHYYQSYPSYSYYPAPQVYNYNTTVYQPYAIPLYSIGYTPPTAVISGSVAYQQAITTTATAGAATAIQSSVQGVLGVEQQQVQQMSLEQRFDRLLAVMEQQAGLAPQALRQEQPHVGILKQHCAACHQGATAKGGLQLFDQAGNHVQPAELATIIYRISTSDAKLRMPPNGQLPYEDHRRLIEGLMTQPQKAEAIQDPKKKEGPF